jgi:hypothetical protein
MPAPNNSRKRIVNFASHSGDELPSSELLRMHAVLCKILHATGMGAYIKRVIDEREDIRCLAEDGTSDISRLVFAFAF